MKKIIQIILAIVFLQACGDATLDPNSNSKRSAKDEIVPLSIGNYWKYNCVSIDSFNNNSYSLYESISKDTLIKGNQYYILNGMYVIANKDYKYFQICFNDSTGFKRVDYDSITYYEALYPSRIGDTFKNRFARYSYVVNNNVKITTKAGTFICYNYQQNDTVSVTDNTGQVKGKYHMYTDLYYSVGIGLIKIKFSLLTLDTKLPFGEGSKELIEYKVN
ncbi:MAG: hypothetical protein NTW25_08150 [Candidatus Kapabacteria bacterium]|nr:hypothetical protein [Candidatus Kapabacteria bacterium]